jgi:hypothetical protein
MGFPHHLASPLEPLLRTVQDLGPLVWGPSNPADAAPYDVHPIPNTGLDATLARSPGGSQGLRHGLYPAPAWSWPRSRWRPATGGCTHRPRESSTEIWVAEPRTGEEEALQEALFRQGLHEPGVRKCSGSADVAVNCGQRPHSVSPSRSPATCCVRSHSRLARPFSMLSGVGCPETSCGIMPRPGRGSCPSLQYPVSGLAGSRAPLRQMAHAAGYGEHEERHFAHHMRLVG